MFLAIDVTKLTTLLTTEIDSDPAKKTAYDGSQIKTLLTTLQTAPYPTGAAATTGVDGLPAAEKVTYARLIKFIKEFYPGVDEDVAGKVTYRGFKFRTDGNSLLTRAKEAWALMGKLTTTMKRYMTYVKDPKFQKFGAARGAQTSEEVKAVELYKKWFDASLKSARIDRVRGIVTNLNKAVTAEDFQIVCEGDPHDGNGLIYPSPIAPGEFGEVRPGDGMNRFYLGPIFFNELTQNIGGSCSLSVAPKMGQTYQQAKNAIFTALNASTITMLHELTHITAIGGTTDVQPDAYKEATCLDRATNHPELAVNNAENYALYAKEILKIIQFNPPQGKR